MTIKSQVIRVLESYFSDTSRTMQETLNGLMEIRKEVDDRIEMISDDMMQPGLNPPKPEGGEL